MYLIPEYLDLERQFHVVASLCGLSFTLRVQVVLIYGFWYAIKMDPKSYNREYLDP